MGKQQEDGAATVTLAFALKKLGANAFDTDLMGAQELTAHCDAWVDHLLRGQAAPGLPDDGELHWTELRAFLDGHTASQARTVRDHLARFSTVIDECVQGFRRIMTAGLQGDEPMKRLLTGVDQAAQTGSLESLRALLPRVVTKAQELIGARQQSQLQEMKKLNTDLQQARAHAFLAKQSSSRDEISGLFNRDHFDATLDRRLKENQPSSVVLIQLLRLEQVNKAYGQKMGDAVLKLVGRAIDALCPAPDFVCARYTGSHFVVISSDLDPGTLRQLAERLVKGIQGVRIPHGAKEVQIEAAAGGAVQATRDNLNALMTRADFSLFAAQAKGAGGVVVPHT